MRELATVLLIIIGLIVIPALVLMLIVWIRHRFRPALFGRELVAEGRFAKVSYGDVITVGHRPLTYPMTVVFFQDRGPYVAYGTLPASFPPGTRVRVWRNRSQDDFSVETCEHP